MATSTLLVVGRIDGTHNITELSTVLEKSLVSALGNAASKRDRDFAQFSASFTKPSNTDAFGSHCMSLVGSHMIRVQYNPSAGQFYSALRDSMTHALNNERKSADEMSVDGRVCVVYIGQVLDVTGEWLLSDSALNGQHLLHRLDSQAARVWWPQLNTYPNLNDKLCLKFVTPLAGTGTLWPMNKGQPHQLSSHVDIHLCQLSIWIDASLQANGKRIGMDSVDTATHEGIRTLAHLALDQHTPLPHQLIDDQNASPPLGCALSAQRPALYLFPGGGLTSLSSGVFTLRGFTVLLGGAYTSHQPPNWWPMIRNLPKLDALIFPDWSASNVLSHRFVTDLIKLGNDQSQLIGELLVPPPLTSAQTATSNADSDLILNLPAIKTGPQMTFWAGHTIASDSLPQSTVLYSKFGWGELKLQPLSQRAGMVLMWSGSQDGNVPPLRLLLPTTQSLDAAPAQALGRLLKALGSVPQLISVIGKPEKNGVKKLSTPASNLKPTKPIPVRTLTPRPATASVPSRTTPSKASDAKPLPAKRPTTESKPSTKTSTPTSRVTATRINTTETSRSASTNKTPTRPHTAPSTRPATKSTVQSKVPLTKPAAQTKKPAQLNTTQRLSEHSKLVASKQQNSLQPTPAASKKTSNSQKPEIDTMLKIDSTTAGTKQRQRPIEPNISESLELAPMDPLISGWKPVEESALPHVVEVKTPGKTFEGTALPVVPGAELYKVHKVEHLNEIDEINTNTGADTFEKPSPPVGSQDEFDAAEAAVQKDVDAGSERGEVSDDVQPLQAVDATTNDVQLLDPAVVDSYPDGLHLTDRDLPPQPMDTVVQLPETGDVVLSMPGMEAYGMSKEGPSVYASRPFEIPEGGQYNTVFFPHNLPEIQHYLLDTAKPQIIGHEESGEETDMSPINNVPVTSPDLIKQQATADSGTDDASVLKHGPYDVVDNSTSTLPAFEPDQQIKDAGEQLNILVNDEAIEDQIPGFHDHTESGPESLKDSLERLDQVEDQRVQRPETFNTELEADKLRDNVGLVENLMIETLPQEGEIEEVDNTERIGVSTTHKVAYSQPPSSMDKHDDHAGGTTIMTDPITAGLTEVEAHKEHTDGYSPGTAEQDQNVEQLTAPDSLTTSDNEMPTTHPDISTHKQEPVVLFGHVDFRAPHTFPTVPSSNLEDVTLDGMELEKSTPGQSDNQSIESNNLDLKVSDMWKQTADLEDDRLTEVDHPIIPGSILDQEICESDATGDGLDIIDTKRAAVSEQDMVDITPMEPEQVTTTFSHQDELAPPQPVADFDVPGQKIADTTVLDTTPDTRHNPDQPSTMHPADSSNVNDSEIYEQLDQVLGLSDQITTEKDHPITGDQTFKQISGDNAIVADTDVRDMDLKLDDNAAADTDVVIVSSVHQDHPSLHNALNDVSFKSDAELSDLFNKYGDSDYVRVTDSQLLQAQSGAVVEDNPAPIDVDVLDTGIDLVDNSIITRDDSEIQLGQAPEQIADVTNDVMVTEMRDHEDKFDDTTVANSIMHHQDDYHIQPVPAAYSDIVRTNVPDIRTGETEFGNSALTGEIRPAPRPSYDVQRLIEAAPQNSPTLLDEDSPDILKQHVGLDDTQVTGAYQLTAAMNPDEGYLPADAEATTNTFVLERNVDDSTLTDSNIVTTSVGQVFATPDQIESGHPELSPSDISLSPMEHDDFDMLDVNRRSEVASSSDVELTERELRVNTSDCSESVEDAEQRITSTGAEDGSKYKISIERSPSFEFKQSLGPGAPYPNEDEMNFTLPSASGNRWGIPDNNEPVQQVHSTTTPIEDMGSIYGYPDGAVPPIGFGPLTVDPLLDQTDDRLNPISPTSEASVDSVVHNIPVPNLDEQVTSTDGADTGDHFRIGFEHLQEQSKMDDQQNNGVHTTDFNGSGVHEDGDKPDGYSMIGLPERYPPTASDSGAIDCQTDDTPHLPEKNGTKGVSNAFEVIGDDHLTTNLHDTSEADMFDPVQAWGKPQGLPTPIMPTTTGRTINTRTNPSSRPTSSALRSGSGARPSSGVQNRPGTKRGTSPAPLSPGPPVYLDLIWVPTYLAHVPYSMAVEFFNRVRARIYVVSGEALHPLIGEALLEGKSKWTPHDVEHLCQTHNPDGSNVISILPTDEAFEWNCWLRTPCGRADKQTGDVRLRNSGFEVLPAVSLCDIEYSAGPVSFRCEGTRIGF